ncbi:MAG: hypothetical protein ABSE46_03930 [Terracidiphilus sp.]|jgi:hypothetical protein
MAIGCVFPSCISLVAQQGATITNAGSAAVVRPVSGPGSVGVETASVYGPSGDSSSNSIGDSGSTAETVAGSGDCRSAAADAGCDAQAAQKSLPNAPSPQSQLEDRPAPQTKRILGIIPNFRAVSTDVKLPPQSAKDKFMDATQDSFDYSSIVIPGMLAAYSMGTKATPEFHQGAAGYARYFWHAAVDQTSENYLVEFVGPVITHEDTRYYTLGRGGFLKRTEYALSRAVITRSDSGKEGFNFSEVVGSGAAAGLSSLYYPTRERSFANTGTEWGLDVGIDAASFVVREFWPDINHKLFHGAKP